MLVERNFIVTMADRKRQDSMDNGSEFTGPNEVTRTVGSAAGNRRAAGESSGSGSVTDLAHRLSEILVADVDGDLLLQQSERENNFLQWLQALDLQVMGACRSDERIKSLLKVNTSSGVAEDRLLAHLSQHFVASEVGLLARCLCVPLVSMRVGKVVKQGTLLCPTSER